ncbi:Disulphide bond corrector protein DsbC [Bryocella elongata]|uniref:Disulphide bond corrector protein DsbC n=1 Tax=Bryocella elongata TaxID=863522 RepID=A0A1H6B269_9BACT|nr:protein-disulfide reductase DsbD N-terminal domain-containing protein [Bryocella elongata]SEG54961.1 Disulphide bond corrector protein DsbC [Bryocella elongata]
MKAVARSLVAALLLAAPFAAVSAQSISLGGDNAHSAAKLQHVLLLSDAVETKVGGSQAIELRFRVEDGFHINSHHPKDELLIPTALKLESAGAVQVLSVDYPAGKPFKLPSSNDPLDVYQNEFRVMLRVAAKSPGTTELNGSLHYQACDNAACFPPRTLPVKVLLTAK